MSGVSTAHVYHRTLDPNSQDSLARLARQIRPGSRVLDLGAGPGVLGRYLAETLDCAVDGVEYNPVAVAAATSWYRRLECVDLESIVLAECFAGQRYDFIICADILEHLRQPGAVLAQLPGLLAPNGRVLLSVPNAAYAGLIAELLAGDFRYRPEGLLDETHLRFLTRDSLLRLLEEHDLRAVALETTIMDLDRSEFAEQWIEGGWVETLPVEVIRALLDRPEALVYQFIVTAVPADGAGDTLISVPSEAAQAAQAALAVRLAARKPPVITTLTVAIVTHAPDPSVLTAVLERLGRALRHAAERGLLDRARLILVDNGPGSDWRESLRRLLDAADLPATVELLSGQGNVGYGAGHNLAFYRGAGEFHLVLNPDVLLEEDALSEGLAFLVAHPDAGLVAPAVWDGDGRRQYLCKRYPTVLDLALRGFAPAGLRRRFRNRLDRYELRDRIGDAVLWNPPIASGCFMLCRRTALERVGGFRPEYFLYFEDFDLSLRLAEVARLAYVPAVRVIHLGGHAARKGVRHVGLFLRAAVKFFNRYGWRGW
ncbi:MAG: methyltransferase domain-containing protein [Candidatus Competibacter sp.]|nr:methyltransferase domain-containing protein [Candidatus Competibacter sp.]MDG4582726.1 methyltransferase domain-containing protein [Candidatus Competibacter sp.]